MQNIILLECSLKFRDIFRRDRFSSPLIVILGEELHAVAAGGVRDLEGMKAMIAAGASRVGASAGVKIVQQSRGEKTTAAPAGY